MHKNADDIAYENYKRFAESVGSPVMDRERWNRTRQYVNVRQPDLINSQESPYGSGGIFQPKRRLDGRSKN